MWFWKLVTVLSQQGMDVSFGNLLAKIVLAASSSHFASCSVPDRIRSYCFAMQATLAEWPDIKCCRGEVHWCRWHCSGSDFL